MARDYDSKSKEDKRNDRNVAMEAGRRKVHPQGIQNPINSLDNNPHQNVTPSGNRRSGYTVSGNDPRHYEE